jgi:hypothetical protein
MCKPATPIGLDDGIKGQGNHVDQGIDCPHLSPSQSRFALRATGIEEVAVRRRGRPEQMPRSMLRCPRLGAPKNCSQLHKTPEDFSTASGENSVPDGANSRQNRVVSVVPRDASVVLMESTHPSLRSMFTSTVRVDQSLVSFIKKIQLMSASYKQPSLSLCTDIFS